MIIVLTLLYLAIRLVNLTAIPIFTDEALYIRWAQWGMLEPQKYFFISLLDGKQPLFVWLIYPFIYFFQDPLFGSRLVSVLTGLGTTLIIYLLSEKIFYSKKAALISSLIYIVFPFALINDRLALYDSLLGFLFLAAIYFQIRLAKDLKVSSSLLAGVLMGLGLLTKSSATFFLLSIPLSMIFLENRSKKTLIKFAKLIFLSIFLAFLISLILYISPLHGMVKIKNEVFLLTLIEFVSNPFYAVLGNLKGLFSYFPPYFSWLWILLIIFQVVRSLWGVIFERKKVTFAENIKVLYLFVLFLIPFVSLAFFAKIIYPRFIFFMTLPLLLILANQINSLISLSKNKLREILLFLILISLPAYNSFLVITKPTEAYLPPTDSEQLLNSWPAGFGVKEVVDYIKSRPPDTQIFIGTEGTEGLFPHALEIYLYKNQNVQIKGYWPVENIPDEVREMAKTKETYFIYKDTLNPKPQENVEEVLRVRRGIGDNWLKLLKITSIQ